MRLRLRLLLLLLSHLFLQLVLLLLLVLLVLAVLLLPMVRSILQRHALYVQYRRGRGRPVMREGERPNKIRIVRPT